MNPMLALELGTMVIGAASNLANLIGQNAQARAQQKAAFEAADWDMAALQDRARQLQDASNLEMFERQRQALRERSKILTAAGEAGVSGSSVLRQINASLLDKSFDIGIHQSNLENALVQTNLDAQDVISNAYGRGAAANKNQNPWLASLAIGGATAVKAKDLIDRSE